MMKKLYSMMCLGIGFVYSYSAYGMPGFESAEIRHIEDIAKTESIENGRQSGIFGKSYAGGPSIAEINAMQASHNQSPVILKTVNANGKMNLIAQEEAGFDLNNNQIREFISSSGRKAFVTPRALSEQQQLNNKAKPLTSTSNQQVGKPVAGLSMFGLSFNNTEPDGRFSFVVDDQSTLNETATKTKNESDAVAQKMLDDAAIKQEKQQKENARLIKIAEEKEAARIAKQEEKEAAAKKAQQEKDARLIKIAEEKEAARIVQQEHDDAVIKKLMMLR